ncbi:MAG: four helix bundle protein [Candidatus Gracilibacteria bacterium]|jgi:four helix bundle protein|nr:four helix bundle protein [Candidatus Gracilibacteria bacterium]
MKFGFENLEVWQLAVDFAVFVRDLTKQFPDDEKFGLVSQMNRAATSIALNLAEGSGRKTKKDFAQFVRVSLGSLLEVVACERIAFAKNYKLSERDKFAEKSQALYFKLIALEKYLRK